ncbi:MAG: hypothetical protein AVDCRST_MAG69-2071, partial [uncultured Solirubrobacteraceae bacterium]
GHHSPHAPDRRRVRRRRRRDAPHPTGQRAHLSGVVADGADLVRGQPRHRQAGARALRRALVAIHDPRRRLRPAGLPVHHLRAAPSARRRARHRRGDLRRSRRARTGRAVDRGSRRRARPHRGPDRAGL